MHEKADITVQRKKDHLDICLNKDVSFNGKTNGFEKYEFEHFAITEVDFKNINLNTDFFGKRISYPFMISCMTGGAKESEKINQQLAEVAEEFNLPLGVGSQRQALENDSHRKSYEIIKSVSDKVPVLGNIGAYQVAKSKEPVDMISRLVDMINASVMVIHVNPLQELMQKEGETDFSGLLKNIEKITNTVNIPIVIKEVGAGISGKAARQLLDINVKGIDVAGAGGTSWSEVELKRNGLVDEYFRNWGIPTSQCLKQIAPLKLDKDFILIASGGISSGVEIAKSLALGADIAASANPVLRKLFKDGSDGVVQMLLDWFETVRKIMYLIGCENIDELKNTTLLKEKES